MTPSETCEPPAIPFYFATEGTHFAPSGLARSPWDRHAVAGGPISALLATGAEDPTLDGALEIARFTVDILGKVPHQPLTLHSDVLRDGRQTKLHRITLLADDRAVAQAHVLRVRRLETPTFPVPHNYPSPDEVAESEGPRSARMAGAIRTRKVIGGPGEPGRGIAWLAMDGHVIAGRPPSSFVKAALFADFGNGFGSATAPAEWSFANLDITIQFLRIPEGEWFLLDAETHMAGNGHGTARNVFADRSGIYARGFQTVFVAPGHASADLPGRAAATTA